MHCPECGSDLIMIHNNGSCTCEECNCHFDDSDALTEDEALDY